MSDTEASEPEGGWEPWMDNPLMLDQPEGFVHEEPAKYFMQVKQPYGAWEPFNSPREKRGEVTRIQAFHLNKGPEGAHLRVWTRRIVWTLDEVPGHGESQTPPEEIIARNEANTKQNDSEA